MEKQKEKVDKTNWHFKHIDEFTKSLIEGGIGKPVVLFDTPLMYRRGGLGAGRYSDRRVFVWNDLGIVNGEVSKKSAPIKVGDYIIGYKNGKIHSWKPKKSKKTS